MTTVDIKINDEVKKIDFCIADKISPNMIANINLLEKFQIRLEMNRTHKGVKAIKYLNEIDCDSK